MVRNLNSVPWAGGAHEQSDALPSVGVRPRPPLRVAHHPPLRLHFPRGITQIKAHGPSRTWNESQEEEKAPPPRGVFVLCHPPLRLHYPRGAIPLDLSCFSSRIPLHAQLSASSHTHHPPLRLHFPRGAFVSVCLCAFLLWCVFALLLCCFGTLVLLFFCALVLRCCGAVVLWCSGSLVLWCFGALLLCINPTSWLPVLQIPILQYEIRMSSQNTPLGAKQWCAK